MKYLKNFYKYRYLLYEIVRKNIKLQYRNSVLGIFWTFLQPLLTTIILVVVFSGVFGGKRAGVVNYPIYLLCGRLIFEFFTQSTKRAMRSIRNSASVIKKVYVPKYIFPLEKSCFSFINMLFSMVALIVVMFFTRAPFHATFVLAVYPMITLFFFSLGIGLFLSSSAIFFRDIIHLWSVFTTALMYASAIIYPVSMLEGSFMGFLINFNPIYWYIDAFRQVVLYGNGLSFMHIVVCLVCAVISMIVGSVVFKKGQDRFILYI